MSGIGKPERATQNRVAALFRDKLGYRHLGNWSDRAGNGNIDEALLTRHLSAGYSPTLIGRALDVLRHEAAPPEKGVGAKVGEKGGKNAGTNAGENAGERLTDNQQRILILLRQNRYPDRSRVPPRNVIDYTYPQSLNDERLSPPGQISTRTGGQNSTYRNTNR